MHRGESKLLLVHCIASPTYMYQPKRKLKKGDGGKQMLRSGILADSN
jgi:hypothetical protein